MVSATKYIFNIYLYIMNMTQRYILVLILLICSNIMWSQEDSTRIKPEITLNIFAGANFSTRTSTTEIPGFTQKLILGSNFGITPEIRIHPHVSVGFGAELSQKGFRMKAQYGDSTLLQRYVANYLDFPIYAKGIFGTGKFEEFFYLGAVMSYWASYHKDETYRYQHTTVSHNDEEILLKLDYPVHYNRFDAGISLGGGCTVKTGIGKFLLDLRFLLGLANIYKSDVFISQQNRTISIRFGYQLPLIK